MARSIGQPAKTNMARVYPSARGAARSLLRVLDFGRRDHFPAALLGDLADDRSFLAIGADRCVARIRLALVIFFCPAAD